MAKIIKLDRSRKARHPKITNNTDDCPHKTATLYTFSRTVRCSICGELLDPFDVLLDMMKGYIPPAGRDNESERFLKEVTKRQRK